MAKSGRDLAGRLRELQLETLHDLALALHSHRSEQELVDDLLQRVCAVVDPSAAAAVTRDSAGVPRAVASVGFEQSLTAADLLRSPMWEELLVEDRALSRHDGVFAEREFDEIHCVPLDYRGRLFGYLSVLDKEARGGHREGFTEEDRRFLTSVAALGAAVLDGVRQVQSLIDRSERLEEENKLLKQQWVHDVEGQKIVAQATPMQQVLEVIERVAPRGVNVLVRGESGTGKELIARLLHQRSEREGPLVVVNCAALPETLLESELFGIEGGVATGVQARIGRFELADQGTLFLDEIGDLDVTLQVKLLRVVQEREVMRLGSQRSKAIDVRLVTATHRPLEELVANGGFREDLYYRLKGVEVVLPPLRDRVEDVPRLARYFLERFCEHERIEIPAISRPAWDLLLSHDYLGNVRELRSIVEGAAALAVGEIDAELLAPLLGEAHAPGPEALDLATLERRHIRRVLRMTSGNKSAAARLLGVNRRTLARRGF